MSSGDIPDFFSGGGKSKFMPTNMNNDYNNTNLNNRLQFSFRSPVTGIQPDSDSQIRQPGYIGKRSQAEFEFQQQNQFRNVKPRSNYNQYSPVDFSAVLSNSPQISSISSDSSNSRYQFPILKQPNLIHPYKDVTNSYSSFLQNSVEQSKEYLNSGVKFSLEDQSEKKMMDFRLKELEKQLLDDDDEEDSGGGEVVSVVTNSEWSQTIRNLSTQKPVSPSPSSSSSSCCSSTSSPPNPDPKQSLIDAAVTVSEGKSEIAIEILTRLQNSANASGTPEQRLVAYMIPALKSRVNYMGIPRVGTELFGKEHRVSTQLLYDVSPCFKLGFMAANLAILEAASEQGFDKIHVVDFELGRGRQYVHLLHALAATKKYTTLTITTFADFASGDNEEIKIVGTGLKALAQKIGVSFSFDVKNLNIHELSRENLGVGSDEALAVNFAFKLYKLPDESVTTENQRDALLRQAKSLSPDIITVVEQEMNTNTAPIAARVREACEHYGALFESLDATMGKDNPDRVKIEVGLGRRMGNAVACEGRDRVERCEVFGKWRARMSMAGLKTQPMSRPIVEWIRSKVKSGLRGDSGFTVEEQCGGVCFGWMGKTLTVASAWRC